MAVFTHDQESAKTLDLVNLAKARQTLESSREELELASKQIGQLKQELEIQQKYYEGKIAEIEQRVKGQAGKINEDLDLTHQDNYTLVQKVESKQQ